VKIINKKKLERMGTGAFVFFRQKRHPFGEPTKLLKKRETMERMGKIILSDKEYPLAHFYARLVTY
jgi:hypothetical protein